MKNLSIIELYIFRRAPFRIVTGKKEYLAFCILK